MRRTQTRDPIYASPILWAVVVATALLGTVVDGAGTGLGLFLGGVVGVLVLSVGLRVRDRLAGGSGQSYRTDPWRD